MSEEELRMKRAKILEDYSALLNMKTVEGESQDVSEPELSSSHKKLETPTSQKK